MSVRTVAHQAQKVAADLGIQMSGSRLRKVVRRFVVDGRSDVDLRTYLLAYADPTGETAIKNVSRNSDR